MTPNAVVIDSADNVATVLVDVAARELVAIADREPLAAREPIPAGHKIALVDIAEREVVRKYGHPIGHAGRRIAAGEHVHVHNLARAED